MHGTLYSKKGKKKSKKFGPALKSAMLSLLWLLHNFTMP